MTPSQQTNPVALETAILSLRRAHSAAVEALIDALKIEEEVVFKRLLGEVDNRVWFQQGALATIRGVRERVQNAEKTIDEFNRRTTETARRREHTGVNL